MTVPASGFRTFVIAWCGQFISLVGSNLTAFALSVYVYRASGSAVTLGAVLSLALLPAILVSPLAGTLVDRWGPGRALLVANAGNTLVTLALGMLLVTGAFRVWDTYLVVAIMSVFGALEIPAFAALTPELTPRQRLGQANGMRIFAQAVSQLLAPVSGGLLLLAIGLRGIVWLDLLSFSPAIVTLVILRVPGTRRAAAPGAGGQSLLADFRGAWRYVAARRGLVLLLAFLGVVNFSAGFIDLLITPLVLAFASPAALGVVLSIGGIGMIATSLVVSATGGPRRRIQGILLSTAVLALATAAGASRPSIAIVAVAAFAFMGALGIVVSLNQGVWQAKVDRGMLGRAMALVNMAAWLPQFVAYALAGVIAQHVFDPLVGVRQVRSAALAELIGHGHGRGIALLLMAISILLALTAGCAALSPRLRHLETELPDAALPADAPDATQQAGGDLARAQEQPS